MEPLDKLGECQNLLVGIVDALRNNHEFVVAIIHSPDGAIDVDHLTLPSFGDKEVRSVDVDYIMPPEGINLEDLERSVVQQALETADNNQTKAAQLLGLTRGRFRVLLKNIKKEDTDED